MEYLALKLTLTPILIGAASLAGRRWGPAIKGAGIALAFLATTFVALAVQGGSLWVIHQQW